MTSPDVEALKLSVGERQSLQHRPSSLLPSPQLAQHHTMSAPPPPQSIPGFSIYVAASWFAVASLLVATIFTVLVFAHYNTYGRLLDEHSQAIWLSKNILPIIEEYDAAQGAQESASTEFSKSIDRYVSFHFPNFPVLTCGGVSF